MSNPPDRGPAPPTIRDLVARQAGEARIDFATGLQLGKYKFGKSYAAQLREIMWLTRGKPGLSPIDYFLYGLADDRRYTAESRRTFVRGGYFGEISAKSRSTLCDLSIDKPSFSAMLSGMGLPVPPTLAYLHINREIDGLTPLHDQADVEAFLRETDQYPLFLKPGAWAGSVGAASLEAYDATDDVVVTFDGERWPVSEVAEVAMDYAGDGYLVQPRIAAHPELHELTQGKLASVRMVLTSEAYEEAPTLKRAVWKIPSRSSAADNFWRKGNVLASVDVETGRLSRSMIRRRLIYDEIEIHPETGTELRGWQYPMWTEMRETVERAARAVPWAPIQGWDVALTDRGVVLMELEGNGGSSLMYQLCFDRGLYEGRFAELCQRIEKNAAKNDPGPLGRIQKQLGVALQMARPSR